MRLHEGTETLSKRQTGGVLLLFEKSEYVLEKGHGAKIITFEDYPNFC
jgi:hypothetical protein